MKKALIAGAASAVLAAMPIAGVFADTYQKQVTDDFTVTILDSCTMTSSNSGSKTFAKTTTAGTLESAVGETSLTVSCNLPTGFDLNARFIDLAGTGEHKIPFSAVTVAAAGNTSVWNAVLSYEGTVEGAAEKGLIADNTNIIDASTKTPAGGSTVKMTYNVSTANNQASGTYSGTATYTLTGEPAVAGV